MGWNRPPLTVDQILAWADHHHAQTGRWPKCHDGPVLANRNERWRNLDNALRYGLRGLNPGSSLARLLDTERGVRNIKDLPPLTEPEIEAWAQDHHGRHGHWPHACSGPVAAAPGEDWYNVDAALMQGLRGLPGGDSLAALLARRLGVRTQAAITRLTVKTILAWADAHKVRTGSWPTAQSGPVEGIAGEDWGHIDNALRMGWRGLTPGGRTLFQLLRRHRGKTRSGKPDLTEAKILKWAIRHRKRTGRRPSLRSGPVLDAPGETWKGIHQALERGSRGLPGGDSLSKLLQREGDHAENGTRDHPRQDDRVGRGPGPGRRAGG
jgi:hypothetical protein